MATETWLVLVNVPAPGTLKLGRPSPLVNANHGNKRRFLTIIRAAGRPERLNVVIYLRMVYPDLFLEIEGPLAALAAP